MEEWRDVVGYENYFKVSNKGNIFSKRSNKIIKLCLHKNGYMVFSTKFGGRETKAYCFKVHRLVAEAFIENPYGKPVVNHIDSNKVNNNAENLEWATYKENSEHCVAMGRHSGLKGEKHSSSKLTEYDVRYIRSVYKPKDKEYGARALSRKFKVNKETILSAINYETWKHI